MARTMDKATNPKLYVPWMAGLEFMGRGSRLRECRNAATPRARLLTTSAGCESSQIRSDLLVGEKQEKCSHKITIRASQKVAGCNHLSPKIRCEKELRLYRSVAESAGRVGPAIK